MQFVLVKDSLSQHVSYVACDGFLYMYTKCLASFGGKYNLPKFYSNINFYPCLQVIY